MSAVALVSGLMLLVLVVCAVGLNRRLVTPLVRITSAMGELARGNFDIVLPGIGAQSTRSAELLRQSRSSSSRPPRLMRDAEDGRAAEAQRKSAMMKLADQFPVRGRQHHRNRRICLEQTRNGGINAHKQC